MVLLMWLLVECWYCGVLGVVRVVSSCWIDVKLFVWLVL